MRMRGSSGWSPHPDEDDERPLASRAKKAGERFNENNLSHGRRWKQEHPDNRPHSSTRGWSDGPGGSGREDGEPPAKSRRRYGDDNTLNGGGPSRQRAASPRGTSLAPPAGVPAIGHPSSGFSDDPGTSQQQQLFGPTKRPTGPTSTVDKKLEKAVSALTLPMLEAVRLSRQKLLYLIEHPKSDEFIWRAYVRYPDLEQIEGHRRDLADVREFRPAQITKVVRRSEPQDAMGVKIPFDLIILQYTVRDDGSLKVRRTKMDVQYVAEDPFTPEELEIWKQALKLFDGRAGAEKLQTLPTMLLSLAEKLKNFTFTDEDIDAIIARKSAGTALDLNLRMAELELQVQQFKKQIEEQAMLDAGKDDESTEEDLEQRLQETEAELAEVVREIKEKGGTLLPSKGAVGAKSVQPALMVNQPYRAKAGLNDWKSLEIAVHVSRLSWISGPHQLDTQSNLTHQWWDSVRHAWRSRIKGVEHQKRLNSTLEGLGVMGVRSASEGRGKFDSNNVGEEPPGTEHHHDSDNNRETPK